MGRSHKVPYQSMSIRLSKYALCPTQNSLPHIEFRAPHTNLHQAGDRCFKDLFNISQKRDGGERARGGEGLENLQSSEQWVVALGRREKVWLEFEPLSSTTKFTTILLGEGGWLGREFFLPFFSHPSSPYPPSRSSHQSQKYVFLYMAEI